MLVNVSYRDRKLEELVRKEVGRSLTLKERFKLGGSGSPKLHITHASQQIMNLLALDNNTNTCNIELRDQGLILRFRALLDTYALVIPFYKLTVFKSSSEEYTFHKDNLFVRVRATSSDIHRFVQKMNNFKHERTPDSIEDL